MIMKKEKSKNKKVVVAMSGGVDSSVAAALLKKQGFFVIGLFMKLWSAEENRCCNIESLESARMVANKLDIPFYVVNFKSEFKKRVVLDYFSEYSQCRTPNPCVLCNKFIKFDLLLKKALSLSADYLVTGHYVRIMHELKTENLKLKTAKDKTKDQSYFLWTLTQDQLKHLLFPIGEYTKKQVRNMAKKWDLPAYNRKESQGLCFVGNLKAKEFLRQNIKAKSGPIKDLNEKIIGTHQGLPFYTVGQRKGLQELKIQDKEIKNKGEIPPMYVIEQNLKKNILYVSEEKDLYQKELLVSKVNWISGAMPKEKDIEAKIRYGHPSVKVKLKTENRKLKILFSKPVRAITPGQSIVFYDNNEMLGGGIIEND